MARSDSRKERWYVARSKPRAEQLAAAALRARGLATFVPEWQRPARRRLIGPEMLFPCYLFVQSDGQPDWELRARSAPNVVRLLGGLNGPEAVPTRLVDEIRARCDNQTVPAPFTRGQRVAMTHGPFRELDAVFESEVPGERARIFVQLLRRLVPVVVELADLRARS